VNDRRLIVRSVLAALIFVGSFSCSSFSGLRVHVGKSVPPDFTFNAGEFAECCTNMSQLKVLEDGSDNVLWHITSLRTIDRPAINSFAVRYGIVPAGFKQELPISGEAPTLVDGKTYLVVAGTPSYVPWARARFRIENGKIVELDVNPHELP
jgi:hypothetical protein